MHRTWFSFPPDKEQGLPQLSGCKYACVRKYACVHVLNELMKMQMGKPGTPKEQPDGLGLNPMSAL